MTNAGKGRLSGVRIIVLIFCGIIGLFLCLSASSEIKSHIDMVDKILLNGKVRNFYGKLIGENWEVVQGSKFKTFSSSDFLLIAHANGFRNDPLENSREGFKASKAHGLKIFEIDIWTNGEGVYCSHEKLTSEGVCDICLLFKGLEKNDTIISDFKNDFDTTLRALVMSQDPVLLKQMIVQLHYPTDAKIFSKFSSYFHKAFYPLPFK